MREFFSRAFGMFGSEPAVLSVHHPKLLFILKGRGGYWGYGAKGTGLWNSVRFVRGMLDDIGILANVVEVVDGNDIDREVNKFRPTHVIVEAFWCVPEKLAELKKLHPTVRWIVRDHSETPFLANEGIGFAWAREYMQIGVEVMCNSRRAQYDMINVARDLSVPEGMVGYAPNFYPICGEVAERPRKDPNYIDIGCFGAIRPLKNHVMQAIAAMEFSRRIGAQLRFHINGGRCEGGGEPILKSLRALLGSRLVEHDWLAHEDFVALSGTMDISMQVSFSETFNIVTADAVAAGVPVVVSPEISWLGTYAHAEPTSCADIVSRLETIWGSPRALRVQRQIQDLKGWNKHVERVWGERFAAT